MTKMGRTEGGRRRENKHKNSTPVRTEAKVDLGITFYTLSHWFDDKGERHVLAGN